MNEAVSRFGLTARLVTAILLGSAVVSLLTLGFERFMPQVSAGGVVGITVVVAVPLLFVLCRYIIMRGLRPAILAVSDGLLSLAERDYSVRLATRRRDEMGVLIRRFNELSNLLRSERNEIYQKEILLETVLGATSLVAVLIDDTGRIVYANMAARQLLADGRRLEGRVLDELLACAPSDIRAAARASDDVLFTCERAANEEPETYHLQRRYFQISGREHTLLLLKPLTRELARKEVDTWKKAIRVLSHEVNNSLAPITSLVHSARIMLEKPQLLPKLEGALGTIEERATHLRSFLDGYASFARLPLPAKRTVAWRDLLKGVEGLFPYKLEGTPPEMPANVDPAQVQQVLINLLKNAVESGSAPEDIVVAFVAVPTGTELHVLDRGRGMSDEVMKNALLPFYSTKKTGSGLGLTLCREILEAHGGRLSLHPREGGGTAVRCWLP